MTARKALDAAQLAELCRMNALGFNDRMIAKALGISRGWIGRERRRLGLDAKFERIAPTIEQLHELATSSDREMARRHGNGSATWSRIRAKHGIARFRAPTVGKDAPPPKPKPVKAISFGKPPSLWAIPQPLPVPPRDTSLAGEAAAFLQRERFHCFNRRKVLGDDGWQVGRMVLDEPAMIDMAKRRGFRPEPWMSA